MSEQINETEYTKHFGLDEKKPDQKKAEKALKYAWDIRKFEIDLYWKRSTHFWTLIGAIFAGYFVVLGSDKIENKDFYALIISCVGLVFSIAWHLANLGSKFWQENWEYQIELLEDDFIGPLYKTTLSKIKEPSTIKHFFTIPIKSHSFSVTKINHITSLFTTIIWLLLVAYSLMSLFSPSDITISHTVLYNLSEPNATVSLLTFTTNIQQTDQTISYWSLAFIIIIITFIFICLLCHARTTKTKKEEINQPEKPRDINSNIVIAQKRETRISPQERFNKF
ncbi:hypothetical protein EST62_02740 [Chlorobaculum sp. 24CR]|uniref:RipA family octameric membrane protein n=1 Tax=Chlorobaculum sp. 24CR TaxID=2508878 RepID=UPI00100A87D3|nr:hypothetical protein [Chlorobaculum sp. 24CR]RXK88445.1 hypothetical protein EST62_02740 [Chlorobaculum sp. 24CR]